MSLSVTNVAWSLIGTIDAQSQSHANSFRLVNATSSEAGLSYQETGKYRRQSFFLNGSNFGTSPEESDTLPLAIVFPTAFSGSFVYYDGGVGVFYKRDQPAGLFNLQPDSPFTNPGFSVEGMDAANSGDVANNVGMVAYSVQRTASGLDFTGKPYSSDEKLLVFGWPDGDQLNPKNTVDVGFTGQVRLARNGQYCCVFGTLATQRVVQIYSFRGTFATPLKTGNDIVVPVSYIDDVCINNAGNRLFVKTSSAVRHYELVSGTWALQGTVTIPLTGNDSIQKISINSDASILVVSSYLGFSTFTLSGSSWVRVANVEISIASTAIDISQNSVFLGLQTSARDFKVYKSTISQVTYDAPVITPGQSFTLAENNAFSGTPAMLVDGLNRQVTSWSASGLPAGLTINASTGIISGTATVKGQFSATITATNPDGSSTESVQFIVQSAIPIFVGAIRATAIYAGAAAARAIYYGAKKL
jgi:hypothetical protein